MTLIEVERPKVVAPIRRPTWLHLAIATLAAAILAAGLTLAIAHRSAPGIPTFIAVGSGPNEVVPTVTVWYADGTKADGGRALSGPWRPDRQVRMFTVVATGSCSITVDELLTDTESAPVNRFAVCVWTAPR